MQRTATNTKVILPGTTIRIFSFQHLTTVAFENSLGILFQRNFAEVMVQKFKVPEVGSMQGVFLRYSAEVKVEKISVPGGGLLE